MSMISEERGLYCRTRGCKVLWQWVRTVTVWRY